MNVLLLPRTELGNALPIPTLDLDNPTGHCHLTPHHVSPFRLLFQLRPV